METGTTKKHIRKQILDRRKEITEEEILRDSHLIIEKILAMEVYQKASCIYVYMDCKGEASTRELIHHAIKDGKKVAAPRVFGEDMKYFYVSSHGDLEPGYFGILEPKTTLPQAEDENALLIVPGVAFDDQRHRCGYGKGFYDRYLFSHPHHPTVAIALDFQLVDQVPFDEFDILPQVLVTPTRVFFQDEKGEII